MLRSPNEKDKFSSKEVIKLIDLTETIKTVVKE